MTGNKLCSGPACRRLTAAHNCRPVQLTSQAATQLRSGPPDLAGRSVGREISRSSRRPLRLCSLPIWMSKPQVNYTMPSKFVQYSPDVQVIIDCTEVRCQNRSSLTLQSEVFSSYKNTKTFKALIGIAPCSAVTFVSSLFSISDRELIE